MRGTVALMMVLSACATAPGRGDGDSDANPNDLACRVQVGRCAPDFALPDTTGALVALSERGGQRVILVGSAMW